MGIGGIVEVGIGGENKYFGKMYVYKKSGPFIRRVVIERFQNSRISTMGRAREARMNAERSGDQNKQIKIAKKKAKLKPRPRPKTHRMRVKAQKHEGCRYQSTDRTAGRKDGPLSALVDIHVIIRNRRLHSAVAAVVVHIRVRRSVGTQRRRQRSVVQPKLAALAQVHSGQAEVQALHARSRGHSELSLASTKSKRLGLKRKRLARRVRLSRQMGLGA